MPPPIAVAAPNAVSAEVARGIVAAGGNTLDAAIGAAMAAMVSEPGVVAPGAGAYVTLAQRGRSPVVFDGYMAVPGLGGRHPDPVSHVATMEYGGGVSTVVGPASIAVPGAWAAFGAAHDRFGALAWEAVLAPVVEVAASGSPLGATAATYLADAFEPIFSHDATGRRALAPGGVLTEAGGSIRIDDLADSLGRLGVAGADDLYRGDLGSMIGEDLWSRGSHLSFADLQAYRPITRRPLQLSASGWRLMTNPAPAVGGSALAVMLARSGSGSVPELIDAQTFVYGWRRRGGDAAVDREMAIRDLLGDPLRSGSTAHVSAAGDGLAVAITLSAGYGSGVIPTGTGMWMNNGLGEVELVGNWSQQDAGTRLNSNMAPTVGTHENGSLLAIGSPGADRITSALAQTLLHLAGGASPTDAICAPRIHVDVGEVIRVAIEPGIDVPETGHEQLRYSDLHMYFGGVGLAMEFADGGVEAVTDPRRNGVALVLD